ncbi:hypothetical protein FOZ60_014296 [Perkinsus olseni]|uniref:Uncharacterized protein n=1 Tax=Perkinsus olseni TaxID=32597 RepID=A0A7J6N858_PEROL|nr:hypothetical protein FOZ60_014296 [Perkinsus olseni]
MLLMLSSWLSKLRIESSRYTESSHLIKLIPHLTQKLDHYFEYTRENEYIKASAYLNPDTRNISSDIEKNSERWVVSDEEGRKCVLRCIDKMGVRREQVDDDGGAEPEKIDQEETLGSDFVLTCAARYVTAQADQKAPLRGTVNFGQAVMILKRYTRSNRARMGATRLRGYMLCKSLPVDEDGKLVTTVK